MSEPIYSSQAQVVRIESTCNQGLTTTSHKVELDLGPGLLTIEISSAQRLEFQKALENHWPLTMSFGHIEQ